LTLDQLTDEEALVRMVPMYFLLYERTGHLKQQITLDDYRALYEFGWRDRAVSAGWEVEFLYDGPEFLMHFRRVAEGVERAPTSNRRTSVLRILHAHNARRNTVAANTRFSGRAV
jgi:hypothetical protein